MSTKVIVGLNIVFSIIVLVLWQKYSEAISRWETDHAVQEMALAQARMTATAQFKAIMATGTVEAAADKATATVEAKADKATATAVTKKISDLGNEQQHTEQKYQETLAQKLGAEAALRLNDEADPTLGTLLAAESVRRYQAVEGDVALRRGIELLSWKPVLQVSRDDLGGRCTNDFRFDPNGQWITTVVLHCRYGDNPIITMRQVNTGKKIITSTQSLYNIITLSSDGELVAWKKSWKNVEILNLNTKQTVFTSPTEGSKAFSSDSQKFALIQENERVVDVLDVATWQVVYHVTHPQSVYWVSFSPSGQWLVTTDINDTIWLWDAQTGQSVKKFPYQGKPDDPYNVFYFFAKNEQILAVLYDEHTLQLWDTVTTKLLQTINLPIDFKNWKISPDGQWLATVDDESGVIRIWSIATGHEITYLMQHKQFLRPLAFSPDSELLVVSSFDGVHIWQTGTWQEIARPFAQSIDKAMFSADSKRLALISFFEGVSVWEKEGAVFTPSLSIRELDPYGYYKSLIYDSTDLEANKVAFSPDRQIFASINDDSRIIEIKNTGNKIKLREMDIPNYGIDKMAFSPDGRWLITTSFHDSGSPTWELVGGTQIWEVATGRLIMNDDEPNENLAFSPNSQWLITNGGHVWEIATGREVVRLGDLMGKETAFSPDNRYILSDEEGTINQWPWQPDDLVAVACQRLSRNLTEAEWRLYLGDEPYRKTCPNL